MIDLRQYEEELKLVLQNILTLKGLVDSGALLSSIAIQITENFEINVISEDYLKYLEKDKKVIEDFVNNTETLNIIQRAIEEFITQKIKLN